MEEYYFTAFESAIHFFENLDKSQLKMDKEEFERSVAENEEKFEKEHAEIEAKGSEIKKEEGSEPSQDGLSQKGDSETCTNDNLKAITEDIAESIHENYKDVIR